MTSNYNRGRRFEYKTRDYLYELGAVYVMRAAQSKGPADLIALFPSFYYLSSLSYYPPQLWIDVCLHPVWLVQCKTDGKLPKSERDVLLNLADQTHAAAIHAYKGPRGTPVVLDRLER